MKSAKIRLSEEEQNLVMNGDWILTKNRVLEQISSFLAELQLSQSKLIDQQAGLPEELLAIPARLTKGENYLGLPYRVLDYPRLFGQEDIFAIRTLFWWGHYFTVSLLLVGEWKRKISGTLIAAMDQLMETEHFICTADNPWINEIGPENYREIRGLSREVWEKIIHEQTFIRISTRHVLSDWETMEERLLGDFVRLLGATCIGNQLPRR